VIYFDSNYVARFYLEDPGWEAVREFAARSSIACSVHGHAEVGSAIHRKFREGALKAMECRQLIEQFELDCSQDAYRWLALSPAVNARVTATYSSLPKSVFLRASDALHLASAAENQLTEIYSNDSRLLAAAKHFGLRAANII